MDIFHVPGYVSNNHSCAKRPFEESRRSTRLICLDVRQVLDAEQVALIYTKQKTFQTYKCAWEQLINKEKINYQQTNRSLRDLSVAVFLYCTSISGFRLTARLSWQPRCCNWKKIKVISAGEKKTNPISSCFIIVLYIANTLVLSCKIVKMINIKKIRPVRFSVP